jgi:hypothetical protein
MLGALDPQRGLHDLLHQIEHEIGHVAAINGRSVTWLARRGGDPSDA